MRPDRVVEARGGGLGMSSIWVHLSGPPLCPARVARRCFGLGSSPRLSTSTENSSSGLQGAPADTCKYTVTRGSLTLLEALEVGVGRACLNSTRCLHEPAVTTCLRMLMGPDRLLPTITPPLWQDFPVAWPLTGHR